MTRPIQRYRIAAYTERINTPVATAEGVTRSAIAQTLSQMHRDHSRVNFLHYAVIYLMADKSTGQPDTLAGVAVRGAVGWSARIQRRVER